jgi:hypothetical protein
MCIITASCYILAVHTVAGPQAVLCTAELGSRCPQFVWATAGPEVSVDEMRAVLDLGAAGRQPTAWPARHNWLGRPERGRIHVAVSIGKIWPVQLPIVSSQVNAWITTRTAPVPTPHSLLDDAQCTPQLSCQAVCHSCIPFAGHSRGRDTESLAGRGKHSLVGGSCEVDDDPILLLTSHYWLLASLHSRVWTGANCMGAGRRKASTFHTHLVLLGVLLFPFQ